MPNRYLIKNISGGSFGLQLETGSIALNNGRTIDVAEFCSEDWILTDTTFRYLIDNRILLVVLDEISGESPYFSQISESGNSVLISNNLNVGNDLDVGNDTDVQNDLEVNNLTVLNDASVANDLIVSNDVDISNDLTVSNDVDIANDLTVFGDITKETDSFTEDVVTTTTADVTLYVRSTGNDSNDGLSIANALATVQEALDRTPKNTRHQVVIDIGSGSFAGAIIDSYYVSSTGKLTIQGALGLVTPATGTNSGTATGGTNLQLTDAGQVWTVNNLRGKMLKVAGEYRFIRQNDATTIDVVGAFSASVNGKAYEIVESKTTITSSGEYGALYYIGCKQSARASFEIKDLNITTGLYAGVFVYLGAPPYLTRVHQSSAPYYGVILNVVSGEFGCEDVWIEGNYYGFMVVTSSMIAGNTRAKRIMSYNNSSYGVFLDNTKGIFLQDIYTISNGGDGVYMSYCHGVVSFINYFRAEGNTGYGIQAWSSLGLDFSDVYVYNNTKSGFKIQDIQFVDVDSGTISNNGEYGVDIDENALSDRSGNSFINMIGTIAIANNTLGGILAKNRSTVALSNCSGSNVGGYGLELQTYSNATITSQTSITGGSGNATINKGTNTLTWGSHFASNGDKVINPSNNCLIERKD